jgi:hypothetical protein
VNNEWRMTNINGVKEEVDEEGNSARMLRRDLTKSLKMLISG